MKAQLAVMVTGMVKIRGFSPISFARTAMMGTSEAAVAVLLLSSVTKEVHTDKIKISEEVGI